MTEGAPDIIVVTSRIDPKELARLTSTFFEDMVKYVVDLDGSSLVGEDPWCRFATDEALQLPPSDHDRPK